MRVEIRAPQPSSRRNRTGSISAIASISNSLVVLLAAGIFSAAARADRLPNVDGIRCSSIESSTLDKADEARVARALGLAVGQPVNLDKVGDGTRKLHREGMVETLWVRMELGKSGVRVLVDGQRLRNLRQLRLTGLSEVESDVEIDARKASGLQEGQNASIASVERLRDSLRTQLADRGYPSAEIVATTVPVDDGAKVDVNVAVKLGPQTVVRSLKIDGAPPAFLSRMRLAMPLREGRPLERRTMEASESALVVFLRSAQFPVARVVGRDVQFSDDNRYADVRFRVETGDRLLFIFRGMQVLDETELRKLLTEDVLSQADGPRIVGDRIVERYRQIGFPFCRVEAQRVAEPLSRRTLVQFQIHEGNRVFTDHINFSGVESTKEEEMRKLFAELADPVLARGVFVEKGLDPAIRAVERRLRTDGYLQASIGAPRIVFSDDKKGVDISCDVVLGPQTILRSVEVRGDKVLAPPEVEKLLGAPIGLPVNLEALRRGRATVLEKIRDQGYLDATLGKEEEASWLLLQDDRRSGMVVVDVNAGPRYRTGAIRVEGNRRTQPKVIERELKVKTGQYLSPTQLQKSEEDVLLLGVFSRVETSAVDDKAAMGKDGERTKDVVIQVSETKRGVGEMGLGAVYEEPRLRVRGFLGVAYRNLWGLNNTASLRTQLSLPFSRAQFIPFIEHATVLSYRAPYPFDLPFNFNGQVGFDQFEISPTGPVLQTRKRVEARLEKKFSPWFSGYYRLYRFEQLKTENITTHEETNESIGSTGPGMVFDFRDDMFNPRKGSYHTLDVEFAHPLLASDNTIGHVMALSRNTFFIKLPGPFYASLYGGVGFAYSLLDQPIADARLRNELALGGQGTIRGFTLRRFTAADRVPVAHKLAYFNFRGELACEIIKDLSFAVFGDSGQLFPDFNTDPRHDGVGIGIRYKTPVGPVVVDFAQGLGPDRESIKFYFTVGTL